MVWPCRLQKDGHTFNRDQAKDTFMGIFYHFRLCGCVLLILVFASCIKEAIEFCLPQTVRIAFKFIRSVDCNEALSESENVNRLTLFIFDDNGLFVQRLDTAFLGVVHEMDVSLLPAPGYRLVAVAGYEEEQLTGIPLVPGVTSLEDVTVATYFEQSDGFLGSAGYTLYQGGNSLTVSPDTPEQTQMITMIQRTKSLNITADGLDGNENYQVVLTGNASRYTFDNKPFFLTGNPPIIVPLMEGEDNILIGKSQINWPLNREGLFTRIQIINPDTGFKLIDENLYKLLERVPGLDTECASIFDIGFLYTTNLKIRIYINQWLVSEKGYELQ